MAAEHLSQNQLVGYRAKTLNPDELLAVDRHLASCNECHDRLTQLSPAALDLSSDFSTDEAFHLDYDQHLVPYVDRAADEIDREIVESHIALCSQCADDIRDLQKFRQQPVPRPVTREIPRRTRPQEGWRWPRVLTPQLTAAVAIAIFLLGLTAATIMWALNNPRQDVETGPAPSLGDKGYPGPWADQATKEPSPDPSLITLNDGGRQITLDKNGRSTGLESLPADLRTTVEDVLAQRKFNKSPALGKLSEIENARLTQGNNSHLVMAVLYWKHGLLAEAERELEALSDENPNSTVAAELLRSLRSLQR